MNGPLECRMQCFFLLLSFLKRYVTLSISLQWKDELSYSTKCLLLCSVEEILIQSFHYGENYVNVFVLLQNSSSSVIHNSSFWLSQMLRISSSFFIVKPFNLCPQGHSSYITHLDWSPDNKFIMSNSGDYEILYCKWLTATSSLFGSVSHSCPIILNSLSI